MKIETYAIICPECQGAEIVGDILCPSCNGMGKIVIPVRARRVPFSFSWKPRWTLVAAFLIDAIAIAAVILWVAKK